MDIDIEKALFDIPPNVEFPMELCHHLRTKLNSVIEQNCHLKRHVIYLDKEVIELRKSKFGHPQDHSENKAISPVNNNSTPENAQSMMASKIVELSKKNRDLTSQFESVKTKLKKVMTENEQLRAYAEKGSEEKEERFESVHHQTTEESNQMTHLTHKMMEYRRKSQQLQIELKTALRALSQEVGDSVTPQTVLNVVGSTSWRGRQQQILSLHQKLADLQTKLAHSKSDILNCSGDGESGLFGDGDAPLSEASFSMAKRFGSTASLVSGCSTIASHRTGLMQQGVKKQEQIRKLNAEIVQVSEDLRNRQQDLKASRARIQTLEIQAKSYRSQIDLLESKFQEKELETKNIFDEMNHLKHDLLFAKDREKRSRDKAGLEIQEANRALTRERSIIDRLQHVINEKQEALQAADSQVIELKNKLELCCSSKVAGGLNALERLQELEIQLRQYSHLLASSDKEQHRLIELVDKSVADADRERHKLIKSQRDSAQIYVVLQQANKCIDDCLDAADITDNGLLEEVENIRTMMRELKTGELYSLDSESHGTRGPCSTKKLRTKIDLLKKELSILKHNLKELTDAHEQEMGKYARVYESLKQEFVENFAKSNNGNPALDDRAKVN